MCTPREYPLLTDEATVNVAYVVVEIIFVVIVIGSPFSLQVTLRFIREIQMNHNRSNSLKFKFALLLYEQNLFAFSLFFFNFSLFSKPNYLNKYDFCIFYFQFHIFICFLGIFHLQIYFFIFIYYI